MDRPNTSDIQHWPTALQKAVFDNPFRYQLRLVTGEVWSFGGAEPCGQYCDDDHEGPVNSRWVHLTDVDAESRVRSGGAFARGVDVAINQIIWVADCPLGS